MLLILQGFSKNLEESISTDDLFERYNYTIGQRIELSFFDTKTINQVYCSVDQNGCENGGYKLSPGQNCICPDGFDSSSGCGELETSDCSNPTLSVGDAFNTIDINEGYAVGTRCHWSLQVSVLKFFFFLVFVLLII